MTKSIISNEKKCFVCGTTENLHLHHVIFGVKRRKADKDGLVVYLCWDHHEGTGGVHGKSGHLIDIKLKKIAEKCWLKHNNATVEDFIKRYGKNYLK